jgi:hypothetical protein
MHDIARLMADNCEGGDAYEEEDQKPEQDPEAEDDKLFANREVYKGEKLDNPVQSVGAAFCHGTPPLVALSGKKIRLSRILTSTEKVVDRAIIKSNPFSSN